jgi:hypothetical protein
VAGATITDIGSIRTAAETFAAEFVKNMSPRFSVSGWRITDPVGATLYEESFTTSIPGTQDPGGQAVTSESITRSLTGKGTPGTVGQKSGQSRITVYAGTWTPDRDLGPRTPLTNVPGAIQLKTYLTNSALLGAEFYGQKVAWHDYVTIQLNAHWQKQYGF